MDQPRNHVFISYSHHDARWRERLEKHLRPLVDPAWLEVWADTRIEPGARWRDEIDAALGRARVAVLLVSSAFLASRFITEVELPRILSRHAREGLSVLWVPVGASGYGATPLAELQAAHDPARPLDTLSRPRAEQALVEVSRRIRDALGGDGPRTDAAEAAYLRAVVDRYARARAERPHDLQRNLLDFFVDPRGSADPPGTRDADPVAFWDLLFPRIQSRSACAVLADFGMGKSWLAQMLLYRLAEARLSGAGEQPAAWTPFLVNLRSLRRPAPPAGVAAVLARLAGPPEPRTLFGAIREQAWAGAFGESRLAAHRPALLSAFEAGRQLFILDGMDEMHREDAHALVAEVAELARATHRSPVVLTCRRSWFRDPADERRLSDSGLDVLYVWPWSQAQLVEYLERAHARGVLPVPEPQALARFDAAYGVRDLASRALLAAMLVDQWDELDPAAGIDLPTLYGRHVEKALLTWQAQRTWTLSMDQLRLCMEELAFLMFQLDTRAIAGEEMDRWFAAKYRALGVARFSRVAARLAQDVQANSLLQRQDTDFVFCHASFGDFLVARRLFRALERGEHAPFALLHRSRQYQPILDNFLVPMVRASGRPALLSSLYRTPAARGAP